MDQYWYFSCPASIFFPYHHNLTFDYPICICIYGQRCGTPGHVDRICIERLADTVPVAAAVTTTGILNGAAAIALSWPAHHP